MSDILPNVWEWYTKKLFAILTHKGKSTKERAKFGQSIFFFMIKQAWNLTKDVYFSYLHYEA